MEDISAALNDRLETEPRLNQYRVPPGDSLKHKPDGWFLSDDLTRLATEGGWWPGHWMLGGEVFDLAELFGYDLVDGIEPEFKWLLVGSVWEHDFFYTPISRSHFDSAPLLGFSAQALWGLYGVSV
jgi:hypothetical protein